MARIRTLVVDDLADFRQFLCSVIDQGNGCEVVGEASDGLRAVQEAERLQPDLILLDLGLPTLNGMEAARRILQHSPHSKILFVTQNSSHEIATAALHLGAHGYLLKSDAPDIPRAVEIILQGGQFVSDQLSKP